MSEADTKKEIELSAKKVLTVLCQQSRRAAHPTIDNEWWSRQSGHLPGPLVRDRTRRHQSAIGRREDGVAVSKQRKRQTTKPKWAIDS